MNRCEVVAQAEATELSLAEEFIARLGSPEPLWAIKTGKYDKIDYLVVNQQAEAFVWLEIRRRTCKLHTYPDTRFPYSKIDVAKDYIITKPTPLGVWIAIKFMDFWAYLPVQLEKQYKKGNWQFKPEDREGDVADQEPVILPIEDLIVLR